MVNTLSIAALAAVLPFSVLAASGTGTSTRYWDCCKPSCAWPGKASVSEPVFTCDKNSNPLSDYNAVSGCESGGTAYTCTNQEPWAANSLVSYGFAATAISGETEADWCCGCYALTFTSGKAIGKIMLVQSVNTGGDLGSNQFDLQIPGGGEGIFDGCTSQFGGIAGARYGGISSRADCASMPAALQSGCDWRFDWFNNADNPTHTFQQIQCPKELTSITGCTRSDDSSFPAFEMPSPATWSPPLPTTTAGANQQCDSLTWDVASACPTGYVCTYQTDYYWQCLPGTSPAASSSSSTTSSSTSTTSSTATTMMTSSTTTEAATTSTSSSTTLTTSTLAAPSPSPTNSGAVSQQYGQCGGIGWTGPTQCAAGFTCMVNGPYYSQCL